IARKAIDMAKDGDIAAIRICMERLAPARRTEPVVLDLPPLGTAADTVDAAATIVAAAAAGELTPSEAADLADVGAIYVRARAGGATPGWAGPPARLKGAPRAGRRPPEAAAGRESRGRESPHAAAAAAVAEPPEQARENARPRAAGVFHLEGPWRYARRRRG